ncbi:sugar transferase [Sphingomonas longa]|nr:MULTISPECIES: sugar transferase [Alphaproteobacteria]
MSMMSRQARRYRYYAALAVSDIMSIFLGFEIGGMLRATTPYTNGFLLATMTAPIFLFFAFNNGSYGNQALIDWRTGLQRAIMALFEALALVLFVAFFLQTSSVVSRLVFGSGSALSLMFLIGGRWLLHRRVRSRLATMRSELVILDRCEIDPIPGAHVIDADAFGLRPDPRDPMMLNRLGSIVRGADYVFVCCRLEDRAQWAHLLKGTDVPAHVMAPEFDQMGATRLGRFHGHPTMQVSTGVMNLRDRFMKRTMDLVLTVPAIVVLTPVLLAIALAIKLDSSGPVLFKQQRLGRGNRLFELYKFRSMRTETCDANGDASTARNDARITRVGRIIRATSLDELPQLINVLRSDMSLVGPRPHALGSLAGLELFWDVDQRYWHRHALKPGITGLAQVRGHRGATLKRDDLINRLQSDLEYFERWTLWRDIGILLSTAKVVVHRNAF